MYEYIVRTTTSCALSWDAKFFDTDAKLNVYVKCVFIFSCSSYISFFFWKCYTDIFALEVKLREIKKNSNNLTRVCLSYDTMLSWIFAHTHSVRNKWISYLKNRVYFQHKNINYCIYEIYVHAEACHEKWMTFVWKTRRLHDIPVLFSLNALKKE